LKSWDIFNVEVEDGDLVVTFLFIGARRLGPRLQALYRWGDGGLGG